MPNPVNFNGQQIIEPGVHSQILGQVPSPAITLPFGNVFLIDTGSQGRGVGAAGISFGGGSGIIGDLQSNGNSIYAFTNPTDFKKFVRGGTLFDLIDYLMAPSLHGNGAAKVYHARAATTTAPTFTFTFPGPSSTVAGVVAMQCKNEGIGSNGVLNSASVPIISRGYGVKIKAGIINTAAFILEFYEGQYRGLGGDGNPLDGIIENNVVQFVVAKSIEFTTVAQLLAWMQTDISFNTYFTVNQSGTTTGSSVIQAAVLSTYSTIQLFAGGTTVYSLAALQAVLDNITDYDNGMFICDDYGVTPSLGGSDTGFGCNKGGLSAFNQAILTHMLTQATYGQKQMYVGGGQDSTQYSNSADGTKDQAIFYNSSLVNIIHSACKVPANVGGTGLPYKYNTSLYSAALACGREAGLQPQTPGTYKDVRIIGLKHELTQPQRVDALLSGVLHFRNVATLGWVINQSIDTLQANSSIIFNNGTSPEISIMRIIHQLNKELTVNGLQFVGGNINTVSPIDLINFTNSYLLARTAEPLNDNLIIAGPHKVAVVYTNGAYYITYCFIPNSPVNQLFWTGYMLDPSVSVGNV